MPQKIEISTKSILTILAIVTGFWLLGKISDILLMIFISVILASALDPIIGWLEKYRLPRPLGIAVVYILLWGIIGGVFASIIPNLVDQTTKLIRLLPSTISQVDFFNNHQQEITSEFLSRVGVLPQNVLQVTFSLFGNLLNVLTTVVLTFYLLIDQKSVKDLIVKTIGRKNPTALSSLITSIEAHLGSWVRGELLLMFAVGICTYIGLLLLGIDIALPLAILAGILEIIPNVGPIISAVPAILVGLTIHPLTGLATASLYFFVQLLENNLLVPKIMQRATGINPMVSIVSLMIGFRLSGPLGAILAIPCVIVAQKIIKFTWYNRT